MYAVEWPCCHDPLRIRPCIDDLSTCSTTPLVKRIRLMPLTFALLPPKSCYPACRRRRATPPPPLPGDEAPRDGISASREKRSLFYAASTYTTAVVHSLSQGSAPPTVLCIMYYVLSTPHADSLDSVPQHIQQVYTLSQGSAPPTVSCIMYYR